MQAHSACLVVTLALHLAAHVQHNQLPLRTRSHLLLIESLVELAWQLAMQGPGGPFKP